MCDRVNSLARSVRDFAFTSILMAACAGAAADDLSITLLGPGRAVAPGSEVRLWVNVINSSPTETKWNFPKELRGKLRTSTGDGAITLKIVNASTAGDVRVAPQGFARAEYSVRLAEGVEGNAVLEADDFRGSAVALDIHSETAPARVATPGSATLEAVRLEELNWKEVKSDPVDYFKRHIYPYEPFYFVAGPDSPNAKFQISFKYQLVDDRSPLAHRAGFFTNLFVGFTQTSLWDWNKASAPFEDSSYKPELLFSQTRLAHAGNEDDWFRLDLQTGVQHESNGRDADASRSLNLAYLRPTFVFGHQDAWQLSLSPRAWVYLPDLDDNPDLPRYRGYVDLRAVIGQADGLQLAAYLRAGDHFDRGSLQLDLTYPLRRIRWAGLTWCLQAQYFTGYGESLLHYNERSEAYRFGFSIYR
jgi:outer membrane phospholipase A